ncbi:MAG: PIG-L deacetylase family protein [Candidatus Methylacidiphilales bacterium]|nr:PIG-L family deacetylase [Candidatus Methylacidiphilales bacterium]
MLQLNRPDRADIYIPDSGKITSFGAALSRTSHLGIGAHQDDLEFMCAAGILACHNNPAQWFGGVILTDGRGSARTGGYGEYSDLEMIEIRKNEQRAAAAIGGYSFVAQLGYLSSELKNPQQLGAVRDIRNILMITRPDIVYTHNPTDKHATHVAVTLRVIQALRELPEEMRPRKVYGCEVWRSLDWMPDKEKVTFNITSNGVLLQKLMGVYDSQIGGGKRYDSATMGRKKANATYMDSHSVDFMDLAEYAMDLTPLMKSPELDIADYACACIRRFEDSVRESIQMQSPAPTPAPVNAEAESAPHA